MKKAVMIALTGLVLLLHACTADSPEQQREKQESSAVAVSDKLDIPWSVARSGDIFYVSERPGTIAEIDAQGNTVHAPVHLEKELYAEGEGGLLGLELAADFETTGNAYVYHTYEENGKLFNRLVLIKKNKGKWTERHPILEEIPGAGIHNGGRVKLGPDGFLYVGTGDAGRPELAQQPDSLGGKILRINTEGNIPPDSPFSSVPVYSYGHRNPQGMAWDSAGRLFSTEHGQSAHDEINEILPGRNYGWPDIQGSTMREGMEAPIFQTGESTWAPSGIAMGNDNLYIAGLRGEAIFKYSFSNKEAEVFIEGFGRIRDVFIEGDNLYFITNNGDGRGASELGGDRLYKVGINGQKSGPGAVK